MKRPWSRSLSRIAPFPIMRGGFGSFIFIFSAFVFLAVSIVFPNSFVGLRANVSDALSPVLIAASKPIQEAAYFVRNITGISSLQSENERLKFENEKLREWYQTALVLESENNSLKELLNVKSEVQANYITARVLADSGGAYVRTLLLSSGSQDGVKKGQAVISGRGLIGRIVEVGEKTSRILLIDDINSRVPILVENSSQHAVLAGENTALPKLIHLPPGSEIEEGSRIITSGHGGLFPYGLPVGKVSMSKNNTPHVELFADFDRMIYVRVRVLDKVQSEGFQKTTP